jgi:hypothetical protein
MIKSYVIENWCLWLKAERDGDGDGDETVITYILHANDSEKRRFRIKGAIEWGAFVQAILEVDHWHEKDESWVDTLKRHGENKTGYDNL